MACDCGFMDLHIKWKGKEIVLYKSEFKETNLAWSLDSVAVSMCAQLLIACDMCNETDSCGMFVLVVQLWQS